MAQPHSLHQPTNVALGKPVAEVFSGTGAHATSAAPDPPLGWVTAAFAGMPDHSLYPETLALDLLDTYTVAAVAFGTGSACTPVGGSPSVVLPAALQICVGRAGVPRWEPVAVTASNKTYYAFAPVPARHVRLVATRFDTAGPNFTLAVPRVCVFGTTTTTSSSPPAMPQIRSFGELPQPAAALLRTEGRVSPIDIDTRAPRLSWALQSTRRGDTVSAWQVQVNRSSSTVIWDTGRRPGPAFSVDYAGPALHTGDQLVWSVRLWDSQGQPTPWAAAQQFAMARLDLADWAGRWIAGNASLLPAGLDGPAHPAVYLRGVVDVPPAPARAVAYFVGLGWGKLYVNGAPASALELSPGYTTYELRTQYNVLDITALLPAAGGRVVLSAVLGDGWYALAHDPSCCAHFQNQPYVNTTRLLLDVDVWLADGRRVTFGSNGSWQWARGEITSAWFNGESVDKAQALPADWMTTFDPSPAGQPWHPVVSVDGPPAIFPGSILTAQKEPPTTVLATLAPQTTRVVPEPAGPGQVYLFELGREVQGRPVVTASANQPVRLRILVCGSMYLFPSTTNLSCDENTAPTLNTGYGPGLYNFSLAGTGAPETYEPMFTYAAIRRVVVHAPAGVVPQLRVRQLAMVQPRAGRLVTSSDTYNWLHESLARTQINYCTGIPNDPTRERVGYTQDMLNMFRGAAFEFASSQPMYARWMVDMADGQTFSVTHPGTGIPPGPGQMPTVIPGPKSDGANSVWWGGMMTWMPWMFYRHYGDDRVLQRFYPNMVAYLDYLVNSTTNQLVNWGLADWNSPLPQCEGWGYRPAAAAINTPGLHRLATALADVAAHLGHAADAARFRALANTTAAAFNAAFLNTSTGQVAYGMQCHQTMALAPPGLLPPDARALVEQVLLDRIQQDGDRLTVGFVSFFHQVLVLADLDPDLLHRLVTRRNYGAPLFDGSCTNRDTPGGHDSTAPGCSPSPYSMSAGAFPSNDIMKETWQGGTALMPSLAGPMLLHSYHTLMGLRVSDALGDAGFRNFSVLPAPVGGLRWLNASYDAPLGTIVVNWWLADPHAFFLELVVPPGATALVGVPAAQPASLWEGGRPLSELYWRPHRAYVQVPSGAYIFNSTTI